MGRARPQYIILEAMGNLPYGSATGGEIKSYESPARKIIKTGAQHSAEYVTSTQDSQTGLIFFLRWKAVILSLR